MVDWRKSWGVAQGRSARGPYPTALGDKILEAERAEWMIVDGGYADGVFLAPNWAT